MIKEHCFTKGWLESFKKQKAHRSIQIDILERMIYALHLLERLKSKGLKFTFKGGTSLVLLLDEETRFSIDIDIICKLERNKLEELLNDVVNDSRFNRYELDEHRSYKPGIPKAHYEFMFDSAVNPTVQGRVLLDILIEEPIYPETEHCLIETKWIEAEVETTVTTPSIPAITGDKLTAFAPNTIGIPYFKGNFDASKEICKQLYDLGRLFDHVTEIPIIYDSFKQHAKQEIAYRKEVDKEFSATIEDVLKDTIETCLLIARREKNPTEESKEKFKQLEKGIRSFGTAYLMVGHFRIEDALAASARVAYLAAKILTNDMSPIEHYDGQDIKELNIEYETFVHLNKLKKQPDKSIFYYWYLTAGLLKNEST